MLGWSALSLLPDIDVVGFLRGVPYGAEWGHRGATHSFAFAIVLGAAFGLATAKSFSRSRLRNILLAIAVVASHPLLDTLTDGGLGCALFWPFDLTRYFAPWRPIMVAPMGSNFFSRYGLLVAMNELILFSPLIAYALWSKRPPVPRLSASIVTWLIASWLVASSDAVRDRVIESLIRADTSYSAGYSDRAFADLSVGESASDVERALGVPHAEIAGFGETRLPRRCRWIRFEDGRAAYFEDSPECVAQGVLVGMSRRDVLTHLGSPTGACRQYSWSPTFGPYPQRVVCFEHEKATEIFRRWHWE
jgi:inner membrane protein